MSKRRILISNFLSLSSVQIANYLLPLITLPYLVRVLGPEKFGLIAFSQAFIQYFILITDYGFNLSATREISIYRDNKEKVSEIFSAVMSIKFALMLLSFLIMSIIVFSFEKFRVEWNIYFLTFGMVFGNVLFPIWFFQGIESMRQIAMLNMLAKAISTFSIFIFIKTQSDYIYVPLINSLGFITAGIIGLWLVVNKFIIKLKIPTTEEIKRQLKEGWHIFISTIAISLYTTSNTFILGIFTNNTIVGYYSAGEKIVRAVLGLLEPVSRTVYPHISKLASESRESALNFIRKLVRFVGITTFFISLMLFVFAPYVSDIILGKQFKESIIVIRILAFLPFIVGLSNIFGIQTMLNFGLKELFTKVLITASFINIVLGLILTPYLKHVGISMSFLITEIFVTLSMYLVLYYRGLNVVQFQLRGKL